MLCGGILLRALVVMLAAAMYVRSRGKKETPLAPAQSIPVRARSEKVSVEPAEPLKSQMPVEPIPQHPVHKPKVEPELPPASVPVVNTEATAPATNATNAIEASSVPKREGHDDLTVIEGIGPKIAAALANAGLDTFEKIAERTPAELERIVRAKGVRLIGKAETWPEQAKLAANGDLEALKAYRRGRGK